MTDEIRPVGMPGPVERRAEDRRGEERRNGQRRAGSESRDLVPSGPLVDETQQVPPQARAAAPRPTADAGAAAFVAQQMGQNGQRRGLKGGPPVLNAARSAYLGTEYSGEAERRPPSGKAAKTEI